MDEVLQRLVAVDQAAAASERGAAAEAAAMLVQGRVAAAERAEQLRRAATVAAAARVQAATLAADAHKAQCLADADLWLAGLERAWRGRFADASAVVQARVSGVDDSRG